jgi:hypothetical protein
MIDFVERDTDRQRRIAGKWYLLKIMSSGEHLLLTPILISYAHPAA